MALTDKIQKLGRTVQLARAAGAPILVGSFASVFSGLILGMFVVGAGLPAASLLLSLAIGVAAGVINGKIFMNNNGDRSLTLGKYHPGDYICVGPAKALGRLDATYHLIHRLTEKYSSYPKIPAKVRAKIDCHVNDLQEFLPQLVSVVDVKTSQPTAVIFFTRPKLNTRGEHDLIPVAQIAVPPLNGATPTPLAANTPAPSFAVTSTMIENALENMPTEERQEKLKMIRDKFREDFRAIGQREWKRAQEEPVTTTVPSRLIPKNAKKKT